MNLLSRPLLISAIVFVLSFDAAFLWQHANSAYTNEFGAHPDEAGHYVTGLMVRDYIAARFPGNPMAYADKYYEHYPKIGLGIWPPFFYVVQSAWTLLFGVSRSSVMLLMALLASVAAQVMYRAVRTEFGHWAGGFAALLFLSLPLVRDQYSMLMAETLSTVLMFGATLLFGRFLEEGRARDAIWFGVTAALAILTKGTGVALALMGLFALAFSGKWRALSRPALWMGGAITLALAGPWTWIFRRKGAGGWEQPGPTLEWTKGALVYFIGKYGAGLGVAAAVLLCVGVWTILRRKQLESAETPAGFLPGKWAAMLGLICGVVLFQSIIPAGREARHLIPAIPAGVAFAVAGFMYLLGRFGIQFAGAGQETATARRSILVFCAAAVVLLVASIFPIAPMRWGGFNALADDAMRDGRGKSMLVSSDARGEGMFIAAVAMRDPQRPSYIVKRASKEFASSEWSGRGYKEKYESDADLLNFLTSGAIQYLVADESMPEDRRMPHHDTLKRALEVDSQHFWQLASSEVYRGGKAMLVPARLFRIEKGRGEAPAGDAGKDPKTK